MLSRNFSLTTRIAAAFILVATMFLSGCYIGPMPGWYPHHHHYYR